MAHSSGDLRNRLIVDKPSGKGLRELHLPAKRPETCPVSVCSCSTQVAKGDAISARLHNCTVLFHTEALELNCSWCSMTPLTDGEAMRIRGGKKLTFHLVLPRPQLAALKAKRISRKDLLSALFYCLRMVFVQTTKQIYRDLLQHVQSLPVLRSSVEERWWEISYIRSLMSLENFTFVGRNGEAGTDKALRSCLCFATHRQSPGYGEEVNGLSDPPCISHPPLTSHFLKPLQTHCKLGFQVSPAGPRARPSR